jgi:hypothetical protein
MKSKFEPSESMKAAALAVFKSMAYKEAIKPVVIGYKTKVLCERKWMVEERFREFLGQDVVDNPQFDYLMSISDFAKYYECCERERKAAGLTLRKEGGCPLSEAETALLEAKSLLIVVMQDVTTISLQKALEMPSAFKEQFIELTLRLLAPFVKLQLPQ